MNTSAKNILSVFTHQPPTKSVSGVLGAFNKAITELEAVQQEHTAHVQKCDAQVSKLNKEAQASREEVAKASTVLGKLKNLISAQ